MLLKGHDTGHAVCVQTATGIARGALFSTYALLTPSTGLFCDPDCAGRRRHRDGAEQVPVRAQPAVHQQGGEAGGVGPEAVRQGAASMDSTKVHQRAQLCLSPAPACRSSFSMLTRCLPIRYPHRPSCSSGRLPRRWRSSRASSATTPALTPQTCSTSCATSTRWRMGPGG